MADTKEYTGVTPFYITSDGSNLLDWSITGAAGGVAKLGINYLKQTETQVSNANGGTITLTFSRTGLNSIPGNIPNTPYTDEQWMHMTSDQYQGQHAPLSWIGVDNRTALFQYCTAFAELEAGEYKLICERIAEYAHVNDYGDIYNIDSVKSQLALVDENDNAIIPLRRIFENASTTRFIHTEIAFTIAEATRVGLMWKGYYQSSWDAQCRFMIVDPDIEPVEFEVGGYSGVSCWQKYTLVVPLRVNSVGGGTKRYDFPIDNPLTAGQTISLANTGISIGTYYGRNRITCDSDVQPTVYVKWKEMDPLPMWAETRPAQVSIYDISEPQSGFDHNGIAVLMPSEITSDKEENGRWDINIIHPIDEYGKWTYLAGQNVVKVNGQLFRIDELETCLDANSEYVQAHANHITYDMADYWVEEAKFTAVDGEDYITRLSAARVQDFPNQQHIVGEYTFDITSDLTGQMECALEDQSIISALFGDDNCLVNRYGGEVYRNNFHLSVNRRMEGAPEGDAFSIRYGTDLTKISFKIDFSNWITNLICVDNFGSLVGVWYDTSGDWIVHHHKTKRVHFTYSELVDPDYAIDRLDKDTMALWSQVSTPTVSIRVEVANIKNDPKYKDYVNLQNYDIGYKGTVYVEHLGINVEMKIVSIRRNELTGEAISITLGNTRRSLIRQTVMSGTICSPNSVEGKNTNNVMSVQRELYATQTALMGQSIDNLELFAIADTERRTIKELEG